MSQQSASQAPMPDKDNLKKLLRTAVAANRKQITEQQLETAAGELLKKASVTKSDVILLGESVTKDREMFAVVDIGDINDVLARGKK